MLDWIDSGLEFSGYFQKHFGDFGELLGGGEVGFASLAVPSGILRSTAVGFASFAGLDGFGGAGFRNENPSDELVGGICSPETEAVFVILGLFFRASYEVQLYGREIPNTPFYQNRAEIAVPIRKNEAVETLQVGFIRFLKLEHFVPDCGENISASD
jgi:hypothetical protein